MLSYNIFVIIFKTFLQIAGCLFFDDIAKHACWIIQLLGITCITKFDKKIINASCSVPDEEVGLFWDGVCFACLLLQLRTFRSYYFCHMVNDTKASNILASRGAQLIEEFQTKQLRLQDEHEKEILEKIKMKMDRIKATQQKLKPIREPKIHAQDDGVGGTSAPLARSTSMSSCAGYHTPIEDEVVTSIIVENGGGSDVPSYIEPLSTSRGNGGGTSAGGGSYVQTQALSPSSAIMTVSLDGYLDPQRLSFGSPPGSDLLPRIPSLDDTFPVFSPPPFNDQVRKSPKQVKQSSTEQQDSNTTESTTQSNTLVPSVLEENTGQSNSLQIQRHRRQSSLNAVSWPDQNVADGTQRRRYSSTLNPPYASADEQSPVYRPRMHHRQSSVSTSIRDSRRRSSYTYNPTDEPSGSTRTGYQRQSSWGPVGEMYHRQSIISTSSRSPNSHHESIRSGDYYMFDELDNKVDLDILVDKSDDEIVEDATADRLKTKLTVGQLIALKLQDMAQIDDDKKKKELKRRSSYPASERVVDARTTISEPIIRDSQPSSPQRGVDSAMDDQQPSTSKGLPTSPKMERTDSKSTIGSIEDTPMDQDEKPSPIKGLLFITTFIESILVSITIRLNRVSRNYRYVMKVLSKEKKTLKSSEGFGMGLKISAALIWGQAPTSEQTATEQVDTAATSTISSGSITLEVVDSPKKSSGENDRTSKDISDKGFQSQVAVKPTPPTQDERRTSMVPEIRILAPSLERGLDDTSLYKKNDIFMDSDDKLKDSEEFSRKEHSVIVDLLAAIWFAMLSHTDFLCYLMVFLNQIQSASILSLPLPLMVFFWGTLTVPRPSKTFWITLIAYTQTVVLLKCVSQFEILWWNQHPIPENQPLAPARIFGIEKKKGYATYDLVLLLVVFFHRFMLKSMGLWKSELRDEVLSDGLYKVKNKKDRSDDGQNGVVIPLDKDSENIIELLIERGMTVQEAFIKNKEFMRILRKDRRLVTLQELIFILSLELQGVVVYGNSQQRIARDGEVVNIVKSNNKELQLTKLNSNDQIEFVNESGDHDKVHVSSLIEDTSHYFPEIVKLASNKYTSSIRQFFKSLLGPASRATRDVYVYMILCDFINFLVLVFGFTSFGSSQGDGGVQAYLQENKIPIPFLIMLILQFLLIIIDRALYLRKFLLGKIIFQYILIGAIHIWMFFALPGVTERSFNKRLAPVMWYLIKCIYLLFSAYQIRCGYPKRSIGNFLAKGYHVINLVSYKVFLSIPFLFELRTLMDWIWTDTTMTLFDWLKMEDIFQSVYQIKCTRQMESDFPKPRGLKTPKLIKYMMGGGVLFILVAIIWFPLALFAFGNTVGTPNPPYDVTVSLRIGPYEPVYTMSAQDSNIISFTDAAYNQLQKQYSKDRVAITFLSNFDAADITAVMLSANSTSLWNISPPDKNRLIEDVDSNNTLTIRFKYSVSRAANSDQKHSDTIIEDRQFELGIGDPQRKILSNMLSGKPDDELLIWPYLYPKFLKVKNQGVLKPTARLLGPDLNEDDDNAFRNISLFIHSDPNSTNTQMWWEMKELCSDPIRKDVLLHLPYDDCENIDVMYLFNDKSFPSQLSSLAASGIVGIYGGMILIIWRFIRGFFSGMYMKIMFEDLPYIDRVLQLCLDIYLVREALEFRLEEDLFAKLIFLYRSPETMIKWTRPKEEESGGEDDDDDGIPPPPADPQISDADYTVRQRKPMQEKIQ